MSNCWFNIQNVYLHNSSQVITLSEYYFPNQVIWNTWYLLYMFYAYTSYVFFWNIPGKRYLDCNVSVVLTLFQMSLNDQMTEQGLNFLSQTNVPFGDFSKESDLDRIYSHLTFHLFRLLNFSQLLIIAGQFVIYYFRSIIGVIISMQSVKATCSSQCYSQR